MAFSDKLQTDNFIGDMPFASNLTLGLYAASTQGVPVVKAIRHGINVTSTMF